MTKLTSKGTFHRTPTHSVPLRKKNPRKQKDINCSKNTETGTQDSGSHPSSTFLGTKARKHQLSLK